MTVKELKYLLDGFDDDTEIVIQPVNSDYVEAIGNNINERLVRRFFGKDDKYLVIKNTSQIGMI